MKNKSNVRVSAGVCEVYINPEPDDTRPVPIISIPPDMLNLDSSTQMLAKSLVIRSVDNVNNDGFECEQILVNENGSCPLEAADYEMRTTNSKIWVKSLGFPPSLITTAVDRPMLRFVAKFTI